MAADLEGPGHSSELFLAHAGPARLPHSAAQPSAQETEPSHNGFSFAAHGNHSLPGGAVHSLASTAHGAATSSPDHDSSLGAGGAVPAGTSVPRAAGSGQPSIAGFINGDGIATFGTDDPSRAAEGGLGWINTASKQHSARGLQREDDGKPAFLAASRSLQAQPTPLDSPPTLVSRSAGAAVGPRTEAGAGLSFLLQPGMSDVPSAGGSLHGDVPLGSPTRAVLAAPPGKSSPGFVHGIPRLNGAAVGGASPCPTGKHSAAGLAAAASFAVASRGPGAGSSMLSSPSAPSRQPYSGGHAIAPMLAGQAQGGLLGQASQASAAAASPQGRKSGAAHGYASSAAAGSVTPSVAYDTAAEGGRRAAAAANGSEDGMATAATAAPDGIVGPGAGARLHSGVVAAPGAQRRVAGPAAAETLQVNSAPLADLPAELPQQARFVLTGATCTIDSRSLAPLERLECCACLNGLWAPANSTETGLCASARHASRRVSCTVV